MLRQISTTSAGYTSVKLPVGALEGFLTALVPTSVASKLHNLVCLPSIFSSVAHEFQFQFASSQLERHFALYGIELQAPEHDFGRASIERDAAQVLRAADALKLEQFSLLGSSHGANVSAVLAATHPERISRLVLVNSNAFVSSEDVEDMKERHNVRLWPKEMREAAMAKLGADSLQDKWSAMVKALHQVEREDGGDLICSHLPHINCKTLVVSGGKNTFMPAFHGEYLSERIVHSRLEVLSNGGNDLITSEATRFNMLLETFLNEPDDRLTQSREFVAVPTRKGN
ncbi:hypothetical protein CCR75_009414 [Bremia lactucae]|uniref:AB hydrolase-1 domain-containing protein n=1 Tax=Bremia lactucae TaxID=4779 RepID=A0A976IH11_BRELC|nr:hypothetical protein CCR75_009414 [Bremia lactucae]